MAITFPWCSSTLAPTLELATATYIFSGMGSNPGERSDKKLRSSYGISSSSVVVGRGDSGGLVYASAGSDLRVEFSMALGTSSNELGIPAECESFEDEKLIPQEFKCSEDSVVQTSPSNLDIDQPAIDVQLAEGLSSRAEQFPRAFTDFLNANGIDPGIYKLHVDIPRYIRLKAPLVEHELLELGQELGEIPVLVPWLPGFYSLSPSINISGSLHYRSGQLYGMDAASGAAVMALDPQPGDHILDLCAAPGAKLSMMAEMLGGSGSLTAVDIARPRLAACRTVLLKYGLGDRCRLFLADGTTFAVGAPAGSAQQAGHAISETANAVGGGSCTVEIPPSSAASSQDTNGGPPCSLPSQSVDASEPSEKTEEIPSTSVGNDSVHERDVQPMHDEANLLLKVPWKRSQVLSKREKRAAERAKRFGREKHGDGLSYIPELVHCGSNSLLPPLEMEIGVEGEGGRGSDEGAACASEGGVDAFYDRVLVDAECTHEGSMKHIAKFKQWGWETFERRFLNPHRIANITELQGKLLANGFRLLKPGGTLVYSTCSFTLAQNEDVVEHFLAKHSDAELVPVQAACDWPCRPGSLPHTLRFDPILSRTSGLFIACFAKKLRSPQNSLPRPH